MTSSVTVKGFLVLFTGPCQPDNVRLNSAPGTDDGTLGGMFLGSLVSNLIHRLQKKTTLLFSFLQFFLDHYRERV